MIMKDKKKFAFVKIPIEAHKKLKSLSLEEQRTIQTIVLRALLKEIGAYNDKEWNNYAFDSDCCNHKPIFNLLYL